MNSMDYEFDELEIGSNVFGGYAHVSYEREPPDPDVGHRGGYNWSIENIYLNIPIPWEIPAETTLYKAVYSQLMKNDWRITEEIERHAN